MTEISDSEARLMERFDPLEMAQLIDCLAYELAWIAEFSKVRSQDESKVFARVNRGALRTINERASKAVMALARLRAGRHRCLEPLVMTASSPHRLKIMRQLDRCARAIAKAKDKREGWLTKLAQEDGFTPCRDCDGWRCTMNCSNAPSYIKRSFP